MTEQTQATAFSAASIKQNIRDLFTVAYYKEGFSGWTRQSRIWWLVGLVVILTTGLMGGINNLSIISMVGGAIGFTTTLAITNGKRLNGLLGAVSVFLISYVAAVSGNYADIALQMGYLLLLDVPVVLFGNAWQKREIRGMDKTGWQIVILGFSISFILLYIMDTKIFISPRPIIDASAAAIGFTGAFLMLGKYSSQYVMWTLQGLLSVTLWGITAMQGDANWVLFATYMLYIGNDVLGLFFSPWRMFNKKK